MADKRPEHGSGPGTNDSSEYAPSKAPETRDEAEEKESVVDSRLIPGGGRGATANVGMSEMDRADVPTEATDLGQTRYGDTPDSGE